MSETPQDHPNVRAIATGTISGAFREWPRVQPEAKALLAERDALREKQCHHGWRGIALREAISTRCPSCGLKSLFIGIGGGLTCASLRCKSPSVEATWEAKDAERDALRAEVERERRERISAESGCETQAAARYAARLARIAAEAERDALRTRVEAVLALHRHSGLGVGERRICQDCGQVLPCPTRRALEGEK